jgi:hypothetical protein
MKNILFVLFAIFISSCKNDDAFLKPEKNYLISEIIKRNNILNLRTDFVYNKDFILDSVKKYSNDSLIDIYQFEYSDKGLTTITSLLETDTKWVIHYNDKNQISKINYEVRNDSTNYAENTYDSSGRLDYIYATLRPYSNIDISIKFNEMGNIETSYFSRYLDYHITVSNYYYDDQINYLKIQNFPSICNSTDYTDIFEDNVFLMNDLELFCENNIASVIGTSSQSGQWVITYNNTYDNESKLIKVEVTNGSYSYIKEFKYIEKQ